MPHLRPVVAEDLDQHEREPGEAEREGDARAARGEHDRGQAGK